MRVALGAIMLAVVNRDYDSGVAEVDRGIIYVETKLRGSNLITGLYCSKSMYNQVISIVRY